MFNELHFKWVMTLVLGAPALWVAFLGIASALSLNLRESWLRSAALTVGWLGVATGLFLFFFAPHSMALEQLPWFSVGDYDYSVSMFITPVAAWFYTLTSFLFVAIAAFSGNYLHRDSGYRRFFLLTSIANFGISLICFAKSGDLLFFGWELVGLASFLLIGFFQNHESAARQSLNAMVNYRIADGFLIIALLFWHALQGNADLSGYHVMAADQQTLWWCTGLCLILGSLGKAGQFPFVTWLPRAMEGPTPSSALFYGGISVHLGPFLLLRTQNMWSHSFSLCAVLFCIGGLTAVYATLVGRTQANVKGQLGYAVMSQIGLMLVEIALGWRHLAIIHLTGHALLRTWQYLRASSFIQDLAENRHLFEWFRAERFGYLEGLLPPSWERTLYPYAVQGFHVSSLQRWLVVRPILRLAKWLNPKRVNNRAPIAPSKLAQNEVGKESA